MATRGFDLFISYASRDATVTIEGRRIHRVRELKRCLEAHRIKGHGRFRTCSYEADFDLEGTVAEAIRAKIEASRALLVLCSRHAAASPHVGQELRDFREVHADAPLIGALIDAPPCEAFPEFFEDGALAADLGAAPGVTRRDWRRNLENESHKVIARAMGLEVADVHDRFRRQRRQRRSVIAGLIVLLLVAASLATWQVIENRTRRSHDEAIRALETNGFEITDRTSGHETYDVLIGPVPGGDGAPVGVRSARIAAQLPRLRELIDVNAIMIDHAVATDAWLETIAGLPDLRELRVASSTITDDGLAHLRKLKSLRVLDLQDTRLTDAGLAHLFGLDGLRALTLGSTAVTEEGRAALRQRLPQCEITLAEHELKVPQVEQYLASFGISARHHNGTGFVIDRIEPGSPAYDADLTAGLVIVELNGQPVVDRAGTVAATAKLQSAQCTLTLDGREARVVLAKSGRALQTFKPAPGYRHDRFGTSPADILLQFHAYTSSFDGPDDDNGDGEGDVLAVPEWTAFEIRSGPDNPENLERRDFGRFSTDPLLVGAGLSPDHEAYRNNPYDRGHLCSTAAARRLGAAGMESTDFMMNVAPQIAQFNRVTWRNLERMTLDWADAYGAVWVIVGPVFWDKTPTEFLERTERPVAIPHAFFRITVREEEGELHVLPILLPQTTRLREPAEYVPYLTSVDVIEALTGLDFFTREAVPEDVVPPRLWPTGGASP